MMIQLSHESYMPAKQRKRSMLTPEEVLRRLQEEIDAALPYLTTKALQEDFAVSTINTLTRALTGMSRGERAKKAAEPEPVEDTGPRDILSMQVQPSTYRKRLLARGDCQCVFCGKRMTADNSTMDHVVPKSKGGQDTPANLVMACLTCNQMKADRTPEEWAADILASTKGGSR